MAPRFLTHGSHLEEPGDFAALGSQLRRLTAPPHGWSPPQLDRLPVERPGIYTLGGGWQVGKSTLARQSGTPLAMVLAEVARSAGTRRT